MNTGLSGAKCFKVRFDQIDVYLSPGGELVGVEHYPMRSRRADRPLRGR